MIKRASMVARKHCATVRAGSPDQNVSRYIGECAQDRTSFFSVRVLFVHVDSCWLLRLAEACPASRAWFSAWRSRLVLTAARCVRWRWFAITVRNPRHLHLWYSSVSMIGAGSL
jgi:hypothetical protein